MCEVTIDDRETDGTRSGTREDAHRAYLLERYKTADNLMARADLTTRFSISEPNWWQWVAMQTSIPHGAKVLEVGCGNGLLWSESRNLGAGGRVCLSDLSIGMVRAARAALGDRCGYMVADVEHIPCVSDRFDIVIANNMLYWAADIAVAIREIGRIVRPDGTLYATTNGRYHKREINQLIAAHTGSEPVLFDLSFRLDNGAEILRSVFDSVELRVFKSMLAVTDPDAVLRWALSVPHGHNVDAGQFRSDVELVIRREGAFHCTTEAGIFIARRSAC